MNTPTKMMISGIVAVLVVAISSGSYSITQVNAQAPPGLPAKCATNYDAECEEISQRLMQEQQQKQAQNQSAATP